jgi:Uma2 family endonuclease
MTITQSVILNIKNVGLSDDQFYQLCQINEYYKFEQTAKDELIILPPSNLITGNREAELNGNLMIWNLQTKPGKVFSSSTVFTLPNGGKRSPDVAWIANERWDSLTIQEKEKFAKICPDFVIELRSRTDSLSQLQEKMQEYLNSGLRLGWLIDPQNQQVEIYRQNQSVEIVSLPTSLSGENVLLGFILELPVFRD